MNNYYIFTDKITNIIRSIQKIESETANPFLVKIESITKDTENCYIFENLEDEFMNYFKFNIWNNFFYFIYFPKNKNNQEISDFKFLPTISIKIEESDANHLIYQDNNDGYLIDTLIFKLKLNTDYIITMKIADKNKILDTVKYFDYSELNLIMEDKAEFIQPVKINNQQYLIKSQYPGKSLLILFNIANHYIYQRQIEIKFSNYQ